MLNKIKIGPKLFGGFAVIICTSIIIGVAAMISMSQMDKADVKLYEKATVPMKDLGTLSSTFHQARLILQDMVRTTDTLALNKKIAAFNGMVETVGKCSDNIQKTIVTDEGRKTFDEFVEARKQFRVYIDQIIALSQAHRTTEAYALIDGPAALAAQAEQNAIDKLVDLKEEVAKNISDQNQKLSDDSTMLIIFCLLIGLIVAIVFGLLLVRSITVPLNKMTGIARKIAEGNIDEKVEHSSGDEIGMLADAFRTLIDSLKGVVNETQTVVQAAGKGIIDKRANADKYSGTYKHLLTDINQLMDSIDEPLQDVLSSINSLANNDTSVKISKQYSGIWDEIKTSINNTISRIEHVTSAINNISRGDINELDAIKKSGKRCEKDELVPAMIRLMEEVKLISEDIVKLSHAATDGKLDVRSDASKHSGDFQKIMAGLNDMLNLIMLPINESMNVLEKVAARDLTARVTGDYKGDHAKLKNSINTTVENLDQALIQVSQATEQVSSASQQISAGSQSLAQGANEQASSLEEVSSSLEEMSSMTKQNAENANQAKSLSAESNSNAATGTEAMSRMSASINKIKESSDQTAKIVKTIDEIAMQTNLLALNAAVEAARAGEAGRGFAVVAEEVRNLAGRSAQAAKNTADMISESVKNADDGVQIAAEVSKSFETIADSAKKVNDLIGEIAAASQEQAQGIEQVNTAVAQMDKVTQQNAANSEESASAAEELSSQAEELQSMIGQFLLTQAVQKKVITVHHPLQQTNPPAVEEEKAVKALLNHGKNGNGKKTFKKSETNGKKFAEELIPLNEEMLKEF